MNDLPETPIPDENSLPPIGRAATWADGEPILWMDDSEPEERPAEPTITGQARRSIFRLSAEREYRINTQLIELDEAIALYPDTPTNYVLRGEVYLQIRYNELAEKDFQRAVELATTAIERNNWGLIAQSVQDRARRGLTLARKRR